MQHHTLRRDLSADLDSRICREIDERCGNRAECRSEAIVQSRKLLDIRYPAHSSSENIFRPGWKIQALPLTRACKRKRNAATHFLGKSTWAQLRAMQVLRAPERKPSEITYFRIQFSSFLRGVNKRCLPNILRIVALRASITREDNSLKKYEILFARRWREHERKREQILLQFVTPYEPPAESTHVLHKIYINFHLMDCW